MPELKNGRYQRRSMKHIFEESQAFLQKDKDYKNFLKRSVNRFRCSSNSRIESCNIKVPEIIKNSDLIGEKHRRI